MLTFIGAGKIRPDSVGDVQSAIKAYVSRLAEEAGVLEYVVYHGRDDPAKIVFYEVYENEAAREAHRTPHLKAMTDILMPAMEGEPITGLFEVLARKD